MLTIEVDNVALPGEVVEIKRGDETLWSDGTGRSADNGYMVGSVVAAKQTWAVKWGVVTQAAYDQIRAVPSGFFGLRVTVGSSVLADITCYRSAVTGEYLGVHGGVGYWKGVEVQFIER